LSVSRKDFKKKKKKPQGQEKPPPQFGEPKGPTQFLKETQKRGRLFGGGHKGNKPGGQIWFVVGVWGEGPRQRGTVRKGPQKCVGGGANR